MFLIKKNIFPELRKAIQGRGKQGKHVSKVKKHQPKDQDAPSTTKNGWKNVLNQIRIRKLIYELGKPNRSYLNEFLTPIYFLPIPRNIFCWESKKTIRRPGNHWETSGKAISSFKNDCPGYAIRRLENGLRESRKGPRILIISQYFSAFWLDKHNNSFLTIRTADKLNTL